MTKSCTTKDDDYPIIYRVLTIPGGAGFRPSTVCLLTLPMSSHPKLNKHTVDGSEIPFPTTVWVYPKPVVNNEISTTCPSTGEWLCRISGVGDCGTSGEWCNATQKKNMATSKIHKGIPKNTDDNCFSSCVLSNVFFWIVYPNNRGRWIRFDLSICFQS